MKRNLYRDEINNDDEPVKIEKDLACFENEVSKILNSGFFSERKITVTSKDYQKLLLFFAVMALRADSAYKQFQSFSKQSQKFYAHWQHDKDMVDFWKRNLGYIVNCRSLDEVMNHEKIDEPFKIFMLRDIFGICGKHISLIEPKDGDFEFIIGDTYPVVVTAYPDKDAPFQYSLHMYSIFPIAPNRLILIVSNGADGAPKEVRVLHDAIFNEPSSTSDCQVSIRVKKAFKEEVQYMNSLIFKEASEGIVFRKDIIRA